MGLGFRILSLGFRILSLGFRILGCLSGFLSGLGSRVIRLSGKGFKRSLRVRGLGVRRALKGFRGLEFREALFEALSQSRASHQRCSRSAWYLLGV